MNYIQKLREHVNKYHAFYMAFQELEAAHHHLENTSYKGDARKRVREAYDVLNAARKDIQENVLTYTTKEE